MKFFNKICLLILVFTHSFVTIQAESTTVREALFYGLKLASGAATYFGRGFLEITRKQNITIHPNPFSKFMGKTLINSSELFDSLHDNLNKCPTNIILDQTTPAQWLIGLGLAYIGYKFYQSHQESKKNISAPKTSELVIRKEHHYFFHFITDNKVDLPKSKIINSDGIGSSLPDLRKMGLNNLD